jgi:hypothetical protein
VFLFALALAQTPPLDVKASPIELMKIHCQAEWPSDFQMQEYCLQQAATGAFQFKQVYDELGKPFEKTLEKCVEEWTKKGIPDYQMIGYCAKTQADAYMRLNSSR